MSRKIQFVLPKFVLWWFDFNTGKVVAPVDVFGICEIFFHEHPKAFNLDLKKYPIFFPSRRPNSFVIRLIHQCNGHVFEILASWSETSTLVFFECNVKNENCCVDPKTISFYKRSKIARLTLIPIQQRFESIGVKMARTSSLKIGHCYFPAAMSDEVISCDIGCLYKVVASRSTNQSAMKICGTTSEEILRCVKIAHGAISSFLMESKQNSLKSSEIQIEFDTEGATITGTSCGLAVATALLSLQLNKPIKTFTSFTGNVHINGSISGIGFCGPKLAAAARNGSEAVFPEENRADVMQVDPNAVVSFISSIKELEALFFE